MEERFRALEVKKHSVKMELVTLVSVNVTHNRKDNVYAGEMLGR